MDEIIKILMRRDGITENEARNLVEECRTEIQDVIENAGMYPSLSFYEEVTDIIETYLNLEPDFLEFLI